MLQTVTSQYKHIPGNEVPFAEYGFSRASLLKNEPFSFQILYRIDREKVSVDKAICTVPVSIAVNGGDLPIEAWRVDYVPVLDAANPFGETGYVGSVPGIYPDVLMPRPAQPTVEPRVRSARDTSYYEVDTDNLLNALPDEWQSLWITVNPDSAVLPCGEHTLRITMTSLKNNQTLSETSVTLEVLDAELPQEYGYYTNWFHVDSLCDTHGVEPYTEEFWSVFTSYIKNAARHRQNLLLLPAFTPLLDSPLDYRRRNVQLVDITRKNGQWHFGFDRMRRFIREAASCGMQYFEHCHLFSQWGAEHAVNIYDTDGNEIFNVKSDAAGDEYRTFIRAYLQAFMAFAEEEGIADRIVYHISDEPVPSQVDSYRRALDTVRDLLEDKVVTEAVGDTVFCRTGLIRTPAASIVRADEFSEASPGCWLYYTCGPAAKLCANRLITNTAARERMLGCQLWHYGAGGFLHWGYNFYYDRMSAGIYDPKSNPCGYKNLPGCSYLAYPVRGGAVPSIREKLMGEAMDDRRALALLESRIGRNAVETLCAGQLGAPITNTLIPQGNALFRLRQAVNAALCK